MIVKKEIISEVVIFELEVANGQYSDWNNFNTEILKDYEITALWGHYTNIKGKTRITFECKLRTQHEL
jgi:hypothetical protein